MVWLETGQQIANVWTRYDKRQDVKEVLAERGMDLCFDWEITVKMTVHAFSRNIAAKQMILQKRKAPLLPRRAYKSKSDSAPFFFLGGGGGGGGNFFTKKKFYKKKKN